MIFLILFQLQSQELTADCFRLLFGEITLNLVRLSIQLY